VFHNDDNSLPDTPETFTVSLNNLPLDGDVTIQRYQVDATTSNLKAFLDNPEQADPNLQMVQTTGRVENGQLTLPQCSLGLGVTLWRILQRP
jgi:hypothetical protein